MNENRAKRGQPELRDFSVQSCACRGATDACCLTFPATSRSEVWTGAKFSLPTRIGIPT